jgi:hypothetical protein
VITLEQYFGAKPHTKDQELAADDLLVRVEAMKQEFYSETGAKPDIDPDTGTEISGSRYGQGDGGFRLPTSTTGRLNSSHKEATGLDNSDQDNALDEWLDTFEHGDGDNWMLDRYGLYREHPSATPTWCHLTTRKPGSGRRTFYP